MCKRNSPDKNRRKKKKKTKQKEHWMFKTNSPDNKKEASTGCVREPPPSPYKNEASMECII